MIAAYVRRKVAGRAAVPLTTDDTAESNTVDTAVDDELHGGANNANNDDSHDDSSSSSSSGSEAEHDNEVQAVELEAWGEEEGETEHNDELQQAGLGTSSKGSVERAVTKQEGPVLCFRPTGKTHYMNCAEQRLCSCTQRATCMLMYSALEPVPLM
jgi:hypothetical protein